MKTLTLTLAAGLALAASARPQDPTAGDPGPGPTAWARFARDLDGTLHPRFDPDTGHLVQALGRVLVEPAGIDEARLEAASRDLLRRARGVVGIDPAALVETYSNRTGSLLTWTAEQTIDGLPVVGSRVDLVFGDDGMLQTLRTVGLLRGTHAAPAFAVRAADAAELARIAPAVHGAAAYAWAPTRVVLAEDGRPVAAWRVHVADPSVVTGTWTVYVDGTTGEVLRIDEAVLGGDVIGAVDGRGIPTKTHETGGPPISGPMPHLWVNGLNREAALGVWTENGCDEEQPDVSGDGALIAYVSDCDGDREIWAMGPAGVAQTQLTDNASDEHSPATDGSGTVIVFVSDATGNDEIWKILSDGTGLTQLTSNGATNRRPRLDAASTRVVFSSDVDGDFELYRMDVDGSGLVQLTDNAAWDGEADFAAGGSAIAYVSDRDGDRELFVMGSDGTGDTQLTFNEVHEGGPSTDFDGEVVVFESAMGLEDAEGPGGAGSGGSAGGAWTRPRDPRTGIWEIHADGVGLRPLVYDGVLARRPALSGDGMTMLYAERTSGALFESIALFHRPSGDTLVLTDGAQTDTAPSLSHDGAVGAWERDGAERSIAGMVLLPGFLGREATDALGVFTMPFPDGVTVSLGASLSGRFARVRDLAPSSSSLRVFTSVTAPALGADMEFNPTGAAELPTTQVTAYQHTTDAHTHAFLTLSKPSFGLPTPLPIDFPFEVFVNDPAGMRNAFYYPLSKSARFFVGRGPGAPNTAYDTILYHEYGHMVDDVFGGLVSTDKGAHPYAFTEGLADVMALATSLGTKVGEDWKGPGTVLRDYSVPVTAGGAGTRQYDCRDCARTTLSGKKVPRPHDHGQAFAGFYDDLRDALGQSIADELVFAAFSMSPPDMNAAVLSMFGRDADPALGFGGTGDPATAPHYDEICAAAARHGFDCFPRPDWGSDGCKIETCPGIPPGVHQTTATEWLGAKVDPQTGCDPPVDPPDEDGVVVPAVWPMGETVDVTVTLSVNPALKGSGRYGGLTRTGKANELRYLYLNAWLLVVAPDGTTVESVHHVLGTGSTSKDAGPDGFAPNTLAFDPEKWGGTSYADAFTIEIPTLPEDRVGIVRFRLDYGEDSGKLKGKNLLMDPMLGGPCGPARYGEVEDYQVLVADLD